MVSVTSWDHIMAPDPDELEALKRDLEGLGFHEVGVSLQGRCINVAFRDRARSRRWSLTFEDIHAARRGLATHLTAEVMES